MVWHDPARLGAARHGVARQGKDWQVGLGPARRGAVRLGLVWPGAVLRGRHFISRKEDHSRLSMEWLGKVEQGVAKSSNFHT